MKSLKCGFLYDENKIKMTVNKFIFSLDIALIILHMLFLPLYIYTSSSILIIYSSIAIIFYIWYFDLCIKRPILFSNIAFIEILIHMILSVNIFGWNAGFQNWTYGLVCAFFLPAVDPVNSSKHKRPIIVGILFIATYYFLLMYLNVFNKNTCANLNDVMTELVFCINTLLSFLAILTFSYFYTSIKKYETEELVKKADFDELTLLYNRRAIKEILNEKIKNKAKFNLAILDIDFFKKVNDAFGHNVGDFILKEIALKLKELTKYDIICSRYGGEEFLIVSPNNMSEKMFIEILQDLRKNIQNTDFNNKKFIIKITVSIGISKYCCKKSLQKTIETADRHLYKAKNTGRNKVVY